jgi:hypothetical protein
MAGCHFEVEIKQGGDLVLSLIDNGELVDDWTFEMDFGSIPLFSAMAIVHCHNHGRRKKAKVYSTPDTDKIINAQLEYWECQTEYCRTLKDAFMRPEKIAAPATRNSKSRKRNPASQPEANPSIPPSPDDFKVLHKIRRTVK